jgi:hypothetical protein
MTNGTTEAPVDNNTGAGLIKFLDTSIEKGWFNVSSAKALRTASTKIMAVENGWESMDLRTLDINHLFERFRNLRHNEYSDDSMRVYKTRFSQAVKMHLGRLDNDPSWKTYGPGGGKTSAAPKNGTPANTGARTKKKSASTAPFASEEPKEENLVEPPIIHQRQESGSLMRFPFPLRDNVDAFLSLPRDLTKDEAARLSAFINSLAREAP